MTAARHSLDPEAPRVREGLLPGEIRAHALAEVHAAWRKYREAVRACARKPKRGRVHRARRFGRELVARLDLLAALDETDALRKLRKRLKAQIDAIGAVRDADVHLSLLKALAPLGGSVRAFRRSLQKGRRRAAPGAAAALKPAKLDRRLRDAIRSLSPAPADTHPRRLHDRLAELLARARRRQPREPVAGIRLHRARAAIRNYRYTLASLSGLLPKSDREDRLHRDQSLLGDIHDWDTLLSRWLAWARNGRIQSAETERVASAIRARRDHLLRQVRLYRRPGAR